jgi:hypothetical protein
MHVSVIGVPASTCRLAARPVGDSSGFLRACRRRSRESDSHHTQCGPALAVTTIAATVGRNRRRYRYFTKGGPVNGRRATQDPDQRLSLQSPVLRHPSVFAPPRTRRSGWTLGAIVRTLTLCASVCEEQIHVTSLCADNSGSLRAQHPAWPPD